MPDAASASAPGRVNLIGEHTDYHEGFVLPAAIPQRTHVRLFRRADRRVAALSLQFDSTREEYELGHEAAGRGWIDYVQAITLVLRQRGIRIPGFDLQIDSQVPVGAGVSSSAALEVSLLRALGLLLDLTLDEIEIARLAHAAETGLVGAPVGIMDQLACSVAREGEALFLDTRSLAFERIPIPELIELVVIHSGLTHAHAGGDYVTRRRESMDAAARLGVGRLRDVDTSALDRLGTLPPPLANRARHVITENARVVEAAAALRGGDAVRLGALFNASHASMRDDYEISTPEIDTLVAIAQRHPDIYGARLTGGGFGGAIVAIAKAGCGRAAARAIADGYAAQTSLTPLILVPS